MTIELRVLSGARAGHRARFARGVVTIGRHPGNDLTLHAELDRDVSSRHAELRVGDDGTAVLTDLGSTNGTLVNGMRTTHASLRDGDIVQLGAEGPRVEVRIVGSEVSADGSDGVGGRAPGDGSDRVGGRLAGVAASDARRDADRDVRKPTAERVAIAVRAETSRLRTIGLAAIALLALGVIGAYWIGTRSSAAEVAEMRRMLAGYDSTTVQLRQQLQQVADTAALARLTRTNDSLRVAAAAASRGSADDRAQIRQQVSRWREGAAAMAAVDMPSINDRNAPAVAYLVSELDGQATAGTAFAVTPEGLMVTNRHIVQAGTGARATRIVVKFRDQAGWRPARIVRVASGADDDLALLQLDDGPPVPSVAGLARDASTLREGSPVITIGYPLGRSTRMDGEDGDAFIAKTSLYPGTVSKSMPSLLQVAAFAGHGSSGSPIFDARGHVAGVVWGGPRESAGQLVYAVPAERVRKLIEGR